MASQRDGELKALLDQFVCVRAVQMGGVDLATFQFDPLLSWSMFFMNADKTIYGRYGLASPQANRNRKDSNPNHTLTGVKASLRKALELHAMYQSSPDEMAKALAGKTGPEPMWRFAEKTPAAAKYKRLKRIDAHETESCVHCHQMHRVMIDSYFMIKKPIPDNMLWFYPRAAVVGFVLDKDHCARVKSVAPGSAAAKAGMKPGDDLLTLAGQPLVSPADVPWVLQNFPDDGGSLRAMVQRGNQTIALDMTLAKGWRRTEDFGWRYRVAGYAAWLWGGVTLADRETGVLVVNRSPGWFKKPNRDARQALQRGDIIQKVDGKGPWTRSTYLAYLMRDKKLGSTVRLEVLRNGKVEKVSFKIPRKQPEVLGH